MIIRFLSFFSFLIFNSRCFFYCLHNINTLSSDARVYFDVYSLMFRVIVRFVSICVFLYSLFYMGGEHKGFYFLLVFFLFAIRIILFVCRHNVFFIMLGWDGLGVTSYLLVSYYSRDSSVICGNITILVNRLGDSGVIIRLRILFPLTSYFRVKVVPLLIIISVTVKRAQLPFSIWLPAAMAAPTPVSSLVHSSTLVTGGVFVIFRLYHCLSDIVKIYLLILGLITTFLSSLRALGEINLKKIIALSTIRHMGLIVMLIGCGNPIMSFFHLLIHAFFKCTLFIFSGLYLHRYIGNLDIRLLERGSTNSGLLYSYGCLGNFRLICFPFRSGFLSKDISLESMYRNSFLFLIYTLSLITILITLAYSLKIISFTCHFSGLKLKLINSNIRYKLLIRFLPILFLVIFMGYFFFYYLIRYKVIFFFFSKKNTCLVMIMIFSLFLLVFWRKKNKVLFKEILNVFSLSGLLINLVNYLEFFFFYFFKIEKNFFEQMVGSLFYTNFSFFNYVRGISFLNKLSFFFFITYLLAFY